MFHTRCLVAVVVSVLISAAACSGSNTTPAPTPAPAAIAQARLQSSGQGGFTNCLLGDCTFSASIQNVGAGCASGTSIVARFYEASGAQVGTDTQMGAVGSSLSAKTIRPQEIVAIASIGFVSGNVVSRMPLYRLFPTWNDVRCP